MHRSLQTSLSLALVLVAASGCSPAGSSSSSGGAGQEADLAQYDELADSLDAARQIFEKNGGQDLTIADNVLFWVDASAGDNPILHSYEAGSQQRTTYDFTIFTPLGKGSHLDKENFAVSPKVVASMNTPDGAQLFAVGQAKQLLGAVTLPAPPFGQNWWAYTISGGDLYVALQKQDDANHTLQKFPNGSGSPQDVLVFDDLVAPNKLNELIDFKIDGDAVVFNDHGRYWMANLSGGKAKWVQNDMEVDSLAFNAQSAVYNQKGEFYRYDFATDTRENLTDKLRANPYRLNTTFASSHLPSQGGVTWCLHGTKLVYVGNDGLFSYDYAGDVVKPILLQPRNGDVTVTYIHPVETNDGTIYVTGLESKSGSVGADGPIFSVPAP